MSETTENTTLGRKDPKLNSDLYGWHLTNVAIHGLCTVMTLAALLRVFSFSGAVLGALVFAAHPASTSAVSPIAGRSSTLCALFYIAGLLGVMLGIWWIALPLAYLASKCKEEALMWPFVAIVTVLAMRGL